MTAHVVRGAARVFDLAAALRPQLWIAAVALFEAGRTFAARSAVGGGLPAPAALPTLASLLAILGAVHLLNGWRDRRSDGVNRKGGPIAAGRLSGRWVGVAAAGCLLLALAAAASPSVTAPGRLLLLAAATLGAAYVTPPLEWKRRAGFDVASQGAGYGIVAFAMGASGEGPLAAEVAVAAIPYACGIATVGLLAMIADREGDAVASQRTTAVALGPERSAALAVSLAVATAVSGLALRDAVPGLWGLSAAAWLTLRGPGASGIRRGRAPGEGAGGEEPTAWIRLAIGLQLLFVVLLVPRTALPLAAAIVLGAVTAFLSRRTGGAGYPLAVWRRSERPSRAERAEVAG